MHFGVSGKGPSNGNADFLSRLPQPATDLDRTGPNRRITPDTVSIHLTQAYGFTVIESFTPGIGLGGLVPPASSCSDPTPLFPCINNDFGDYRRHGPRMDTLDSAQLPRPFVTAIAAPNLAPDHLTSFPLALILFKPLPPDRLTTMPSAPILLLALPPTRLAAFSLVHVTIKTPPRYHLTASPPSHTLPKTKTLPRHRLTAFPPANALSKTKTLPRHRLTALPSAN